MNRDERGPSKVTLTITANAWTWRAIAPTGKTLVEHTMQRTGPGCFSGTQKGDIFDAFSVHAEKAGLNEDCFGELADAIDGASMFQMDVCRALNFIGEQDPEDPGLLRKKRKSKPPTTSLSESSDALNEKGG